MDTTFMQIVDGIDERIREGTRGFRYDLPPMGRYRNPADVIARVSRYYSNLGWQVRHHPKQGGKHGCLTFYRRDSVRCPSSSVEGGRAATKSGCG